MAIKGIHRSLETEFKKGMQARGRPFVKGQVAWNKGLKGVYHPTPEAREKARQSHIGKRYDGGKHWVSKTCKECGNEFEVKRGAGKKRVYCSRRCSTIKRTENCEGNVSFHALGYKMIRRNGNVLFEHRLVMEQVLGRPLKKQEIVHHINGERLDNRPENLMIMSHASHWGLVHYLARLWIKEHSDMVNKVTREFEITFSAGG